MSDHKQAGRAVAAALIEQRIRSLIPEPKEPDSSQATEKEGA